MDKIIHRIGSLCVLILFFWAGPCLAQNAATHTVKAGETLFGIAKANGVSVQQIKQWNDLSGSTLSVGQTLILKNKGKSGPPVSGISHKVKPHETLYSIAKKYSVSVDDLKKWNSIKEPNLAVGSTLVIHPGETSRTSSASNQKQAQGKSEYTVKSGDSLFRIARAHNISVARIKEMNNLSSNNIQVGQHLILQPTDRPPSLSAEGVESSSQGRFIRYTVKSNQQRAELLKKFQMDESEFQALNPGLEQRSFGRGDKVTLLAPANRSFKNPYQTDEPLQSLGTMHATAYTNNAVRPTASGELYNPKALTAAHANMALGSLIFVQNSQNKRGVLVLINDRSTGGGLKLSEAAWHVLALSGSSATVTIYRGNE